MIKTYVNEEKRCVYAVTKGCSLDAVVRIIKHNPYIDFESALDDEGKLAFGLHHALMEDKYTAVAKCHPDDVFDAKEGKRIAKEKLIKKLNEASDKAVERWIKHQNNIMKAL